MKRTRAAVTAVLLTGSLAGGALATAAPALAAPAATGPTTTSAAPAPGSVRPIAGSDATSRQVVGAWYARFLDARPPGPLRGLAVLGRAPGPR